MFHSILRHISSSFIHHGGTGTPICPFWRENKFFNSFSFHLFRSMLTIINLIVSISCLFPDFLFDHQQSASGAGDNRFFELSNCSLYFLLSFYIFKSFFIFYFGHEGDMEEAVPLEPVIIGFLNCLIVLFILD